MVRSGTDARYRVRYAPFPAAQAREATVKSGGRSAETGLSTMNAVPPSGPGAVSGYMAGDLQIDLRTRRVLRDGAELEVTSLSFDLLLALVKAAPALVTFDTLMQSVWSGVVVSPETLTQRVKLLRQALGDSADNPRYIVAVRGHGYRMLAAAAPLPAPTDVADQPVAAIPPRAPAVRPTRRWLVPAMLVMLIACAGGWWALAHRPANEPVRAHVDEAHRLFLLAESIVDGTPTSFQAAISLYDQVLALDGRRARAYSGRAMNRAALVWSGSGLGNGNGLEDAQRDAERALELDQQDSRAYAVLGNVHALRGRWAAGETAFRAAIDTSPADGSVHGQYAVSLLLPTGQLRKAAAEAAQAQELRSDSGFTMSMRAMVELARGADGAALHLAELAESRGANPGPLRPVQASHAMRNGRYAEAAGHAIRSLPLSLRDAGGESMLRQAYAALDDPALRPQGLEALRRLTSEPGWQRVEVATRQILVQLLAELGAVDDLYRELGHMLDGDHETYPWITVIGSMWSPRMRPFRMDPRFQALAQRLGLIEYWQQAGPPDACMLAGETVTCR